MQITNSVAFVNNCVLVAGRYDNNDNKQEQCVNNIAVVGNARQHNMSARRSNGRKHKGNGKLS